MSNQYWTHTDCLLIALESSEVTGSMELLRRVEGIGEHSEIIIQSERMICIYRYN